jgi:predicted kinase
VTTLYLLCGLPGAGKSTRAAEITASTRAIHLSPDEWIPPLGLSLVDYEFRFKFQDVMLVHAGKLLALGVSTVIEFGSWARDDRERIRQVGVDAGARTELHFLDAPVDELARRVLSRGGPGAEKLVSDVLPSADQFERPTPEETERWDRYVGPSAE